MKSTLRVALEALMERTIAAEREVVSDELWEVFGDERTAVHRASVLAAIVRVGRHYGVAGVARLLDVQPSNATTFVKDLEEHGLVHRIVREGSNKHAILLTQEGAEALAAAEGHDDRVLDVVLAELSEEDRACFVSVMEKLLTDSEE